MKIVPVEQGSVSWLEARAGVVTASEADALITPLYAVRKSEGVETYMARKLAEKWGGPLPQPKVFAMEQGNILEDEARPWYAFEFGVKIETPGLIVTDDGRAGCSPDGMILWGKGQEGLEIKCPSRPIHTAYLLSGIVPKEYRAQVQFSLWVTGFPSWKFVSYCRQMPPLILTVEPDPKAFEAIEIALGYLYNNFDAAWKRLVELNDGKEPQKFEHVPMSWEQQTETDPNEVLQ